MTRDNQSPNSQGYLAKKLGSSKASPFYKKYQANGIADPFEGNPDQAGYYYGAQKKQSPPLSTGLNFDFSPFGGSYTGAKKSKKLYHFLFFLQLILLVIIFTQSLRYFYYKFKT